MPMRWIAVSLFLLCAGCAPIVVGTGATGVYKSASDKRTFGNQVDDATLTARVKTALAECREVPTFSVDVDTIEGVVTLTGIVDNEGVVRNVEAVVRKVSGVKDVNNLLQVGPTSIGQALDDKVVGIKVKSELIASPDVDALHIDVDVNNGVVTLTGVLKSAAMRDEAVRLADRLVGVKRVENNLVVR